MYKPEWFQPYELVPREIYEGWNPEKMNNIWFLFDERMLYTGDRLRERYGKAIANTWYWKGGVCQYRGWRPSRSQVKDDKQPKWSDFSQHCAGRGKDLVFAEYDVEKIRKDILDDPFHPDFKYITCIEIDIDWLHFDTKNWDKDTYGILIVKP